MSADEADKKNVEDETKDNATAAEENGESDAPEEKVNSKSSHKKKAAEAPKIKQPAKKRVKTEQAEKEIKKEEKKEKKVKVEEKEEEDDENVESADENDVGNHKAVPLLDQPLQIEGSRRRKEVQRFISTGPEEDNKDIEIPEGKGKTLGTIERIDFNIQRAKPEDLKLLHRLCFGKQCKAAVLKKNIKKFNGFEFEEASDEYEKRKTIIGKNKKITVAQLKNVCNVVDVEKSGTKDEILERILSFLACPVDSGKKLPGVGRSKRSGTSAKNYDEGDEKFTSKKKGKGKKKSEESEDSEKEKSDVEEEEVKEEKVKKSEKKKNHAQSSEESKSDDEEKKEEEEEEVEEEEKPKKGARKGKKTTEAAEKKAPPKKRAAAKRAVEKKSESEGDEESDEDEPLAKKSQAPPTDEEIKTYVKSLLEGANLELITMKKVCQDVYAHYPDFDLGHKKDYIKTTVKSLISS